MSEREREIEKYREELEGRKESGPERLPIEINMDEITLFLSTLLLLTQQTIFPVKIFSLPP